MVKIGNFFFHHRNYLFPFFYLILFVPAPQITQYYTFVLIAGLSLSIFGQAVRILTIGLVYIHRGGRNRKIYAEGLVTDGIFAHCRNPMYVGNVLMLTGMAILSNSLLSVLIIAPFFLFIYQSIILAEEDFLHGKFGPDYEKYCANTDQWFPRMKGLGSTIHSLQFRTKDAVFKEYNTTYLWMTGAVMIIAVNFFRMHGKSYFEAHLPVLAWLWILITMGYLSLKLIDKKKLFFFSKQ